MLRKVFSKTLLLIWINLFIILILFFLFARIQKIDQSSVFESFFTKIRVKVFALFNKPLCPDCNIILVSLDTLSANHLPCYGYNRNTAPNLCAFAKENVLFTNTSSNATFTLPSHVSLFTGLLPSKHGVNITNQDRLSTNLPFLPAILQKKGYKTYLYMPKTNHLPVDKVYNRGIDEVTYAHQISDWEKGLRQFENNVEKGQKTFLFLHTYYPHSPYIPGEPGIIYAKKTFPDIMLSWRVYSACTPEFASFFRKNLKEDLSAGFWGDETAKYTKLSIDMDNQIENITLACDISQKIGHGQYQERYYWSKINTSDPEQIQYIKDLYDQRINELDQKLTSLFELIKNYKYKNNTVVIFTSDHGEEFMEHGFTQHSTVYDSNTRILLAMQIPGVDNKTLTSPVQTIDVAPTILDLVGIDTPPVLQGTSLMKFITQKKDNITDRYIITEGTLGQRYAIHNAQYKLILKGTGGDYVPYELYDILEDPKEINNIIFLNTEITNNLKNKFKFLINK